jgi:hypothetical protein
VCVLVGKLWEFTKLLVGLDAIALIGLSQGGSPRQPSSSLALVDLRPYA